MFFSWSDDTFVLLPCAAGRRHTTLQPNNVLLKSVTLPPQRLRCGSKTKETLKHFMDEKSDKDAVKGGIGLQE